MIRHVPTAWHLCGCVYAPVCCVQLASNWVKHGAGCHAVLLLLVAVAAVVAAAAGATERGMLLQKLKDYRKAVKELNKAAKSDPKNPQVCLRFKEAG